MNNVKNNLRKDFTITPNELINDDSLTPQARFLFTYMASKPDDWKFVQEPMAKNFNWSLPTLRKYLKELLAAGWISRERSRDEGKFDSFDYTLHSSPSAHVDQDHQVQKKPTWEKPNMGKFSTTKKYSLQKRNNSLSSANDFSSCSDRVTASLSLIETEIRKNSEVLGEQLSKQDRDYVLNEIPKWLKYHAKREGFFDDPIGNLQYGPYSLERWVNGDRNKGKETREKTKNADYIAYLERAKMETPGTRSGKVIPLNEKEYTIFKKFIETNETYAFLVEKFMSEVLSQINTPDDDSKILLGRIYNARAPFMRLPTIPQMEEMLSDAASKNSVSLEENS